MRHEHKLTKRYSASPHYSLQPTPVPLANLLNLTDLARNSVNLQDNCKSKNGAIMKAIMEEIFNNNSKWQLERKIKLTRLHFWVRNHQSLLLWSNSAAIGVLTLKKSKNEMCFALGPYFFSSYSKKKKFVSAASYSSGFFLAMITKLSLSSLLSRPRQSALFILSGHFGLSVDCTDSISRETLKFKQSYSQGRCTV